MAKRALLACATVIASARGISIGDVLPAATLDSGFPPTAVTTKELCENKKIVLVGLPGAFTPTWSTRQIPGYLAKEAELKAQGIDQVVVFSVNDGAVMTAWAEDQKTKGTIVNLLGDTRMELTKALGVTLDHPGPMSVLGNNRCQRFSMYISNCKIKTFNLAAAEDDPAGDDRPEISMAEKMLEDLTALSSKSEL